MSDERLLVTHHSLLITHYSLLFNPNHRIDHRDNLQPLRARDLDESVRHERFAAVLLPPAADEDVIADFADGELAGGGASCLAELHNDEIAVLDADVVEVVAARAEDDLAFLDERRGDEHHLGLLLVGRF